MGNRAILISVHPKHVINIVDLKKWIEARKIKPSCELPIDVYIHVSKRSPWIFIENNIVTKRLCAFRGYKSGRNDNGQIVAMFTLKKVESITCGWRYEDCLYHYETSTLTEKELLKDVCLSHIEMSDYFGKDGKTISNIVGYAWHIDELLVFKKPMQLTDFHKPGYFDALMEVQSHVDDVVGSSVYPGDEPSSHLQSWIDKQFDDLEKEFQITKAPQSYCYVEVE